MSGWSAARISLIFFPRWLSHIHPDLSFSWSKYIHWPPDVKNWLIAKDPDARKDWRQEKGTTEDEMVGWHHRLDGHEFEQALGVGDGQGSLLCCSPGGCKELDTTEQLNWNEYTEHVLCVQPWLHGLYVSIRQKQVFAELRVWLINKVPSHETVKELNIDLNSHVCYRLCYKFSSSLQAENNLDGRIFVKELFTCVGAPQDHTQV